MEINPKRGFDRADRDDFTGSALLRLKTAREELIWLLDRGYSMDTASTFVGNHHSLTARQRNAMKRSSSSRSDLKQRLGKRISPSEINGKEVLIDGFNIIITLETSLSGSLLILCGDGVIRDLAGLRGTYHLIPQTDTAISLLLESLERLGTASAKIYLDSPVSNSGRLKKRILEISSTFRLPVEVSLADDSDKSMAGKERIITGDSILLDSCTSWVNLTREIILSSVPDPFIADLSE
ncbi:DUF434 domain-containing protein [Youngiibacter multivorans]|uniref:DUF434 domain-containing protein n=1 Tax=Youngiibacter multivorans TaxID=937251 RepID=A0ABS4G4A1_9CLOT|nr:DUF434 domain-containing protein [Youngiibacter multivorans]MBP1919361.1 hypothetical protein [Youngiibacter multivorans]